MKVLSLCLAIFALIIAALMFPLENHTRVDIVKSTHIYKMVKRVGDE